MTKKRILFVRTYFPHWAEYSGINQVIKYFDTEKYDIKELLVNMGEKDFPIQNRYFKKITNLFLKLSANRYYNLNDFAAEFAVIKKWWNNEFDILHYFNPEHTLFFVPFIIRLFKFLKKEPIIITTFNQPPDILKNIIRKKRIRKLDHIIVLSPEQKYFFSKFYPIKNISLILHGVDVNFYKPNESIKNKEKFTSLSVGKWLRDYDAVFKTAKILSGYKDIEFHIVSSPIDFTEDLHNIHFHTNIDDDELLRLYQSTNIIFLPLHQATANNAILEGAACGLAIISTNLDSIKGYMPDDESFLIDNNDENIFAEHILKLYKDRLLLTEMSKKARERAKELSWNNIVQEYENLYSFYY